MSVLDGESLDPSEDYARESRRLCRQAATTACFVAIPLVPLFAVLDRILYPEHAGPFLVMRLVCVAILAAILGVLRRPAGERHALALALLVTVAIGGMIDAMTMVTGGHASPYYAGVNLIILYVALVMPWRPAWTVLSCGLLVGGYVLGALVEGPVEQPRTFASNLFFLCATAAIAVVGTAVRETLRRRDFVNRRALQRALRHRDEFLAKMTHELRTPLHVMIGYADILLEEGLGRGATEARPLVERIRGHGVLLHRLISDLLDFSKAEAGKMEVRVEPVRVRALVDQVAEDFRPLSERKGLGLRTLHRDGDPTVVTDRQKIEQILTNLVGNALKFTERGAITIEVRARVDPDDRTFADLVFLGEPPRAEGGEGVVVLVRDTGIGIRSEDLRTLAADFHQPDAEAAAQHGGTGLGLSISKRLAELLGGWIAVSSRHRQGSTFIVFLPSLAPVDTGTRRHAA